MVYNFGMRVVDYLKETYGYSVPIFLKDIRMGGKSKQAIRKELSRASMTGEIVRKSQGVYYLAEDTLLGTPSILSFEKVAEKKFVKDDFGLPGLELNIYGYYTGLTFLHQIGISQQVPAVLEIATNNTSCKRYYTCSDIEPYYEKEKLQLIVLITRLFNSLICFIF